MKPISGRIKGSLDGQVAAASSGPGKAARVRRTPPGARAAAKSDYVLIVDGEAAFADLLETELAASGLETIRASDAESAERLLMEKSPRAVVLDLRYARLPRTAVLEQLPAGPDANLPIAMLTSASVPATELSVEPGVEHLPEPAVAPQAATAQALMS